MNSFKQSIHIKDFPRKKIIFDISFQLLSFGILISNIDLSNRIRSKMAFIDVPHHLPMRANEGPTPFPVTGYSFINYVSNQFTSIKSMRRFHQREQFCFLIIKVKFIIRMVENHKIKLEHSTCIWEFLLYGTNRDSRWWSTSSRWHINQLITFSHGKFRCPEF